jgi:phytoene dehydrogenase-like protein
MWSQDQGVGSFDGAYDDHPFVDSVAASAGTAAAGAYVCGAGASTGSGMNAVAGAA